MCGIFSLLNYENKYSIEFISKQFKKGRARGPENSQLCKVSRKLMFGFHRLAINGLSNESSQPLIKGDIILICNGEIYNYKELYEMMDSPTDDPIIPSTQSDCEVILWLYEKYGIEHTLQLLDGVFAFVLLDQRYNIGEPLLYVARDPYGVRPLYSINQIANSVDRECTIGFASELKVLSQFVIDFPQTKYQTIQFMPGSYSTYTFSDKVCSEWTSISQNTVYHRTGFSKTLYNPMEITTSVHEIVDGIQTYLIAAVEKRCCTTERPIACLLSGGLDSSIITALVSEYHKQKGLPPIETYSIGLAESVDLKYAKMVADHLGTKHTEIILTEEDFCNAIPAVIQAIESYDTTTVRASIGNYLLGQYIAKHSEAKVIFNGDGSDELLGGYLYMKNAPDCIEFDKECRRLLKDIHTFDVLRSDKSISSHGLEPRTPFLDRAWTQYYLSISPTLRQFAGESEKYWLRYAFAKQQYIPPSGLASLLPDKVLWRKKEAFSDGVSGEHRSLYQILQDYCTRLFPLQGNTTYEEMAKQNPFMRKVETNIPKTAEQYYYRYVFETNYMGMGSIIPYFWMPKYVNATDASARTLATYQSDTNTHIFGNASVERSSNVFI
uniref:asparagine synthase (glutamine-hydrolyzing) n=1 Tax=viral metagenome TaxID=1070528 RepID=A0A6C0HH41_9ZZZZ